MSHPASASRPMLSASARESPNVWHPGQSRNEINQYFPSRVSFARYCMVSFTRRFRCRIFVDRATDPLIHVRGSYGLVKIFEAGQGAHVNHALQVSSRSNIGIPTVVWASIVKSLHIHHPIGGSHAHDVTVSLRHD